MSDNLQVQSTVMFSGAPRGAVRNSTQAKHKTPILTYLLARYMQLR